MTRIGPRMQECIDFVTWFPGVAITLAQEKYGARVVKRCIDGDYVWTYQAKGPQIVLIPAK